MITQWSILLISQLQRWWEDDVVAVELVRHTTCGLLVLINNGDHHAANPHAEDVKLL